MRLVKEVLLQRYLESLLRLSKIPICGAKFLNFSRLGQLVYPDIYNCNAIYCLQYKMRAFDYFQEATLTLAQKESQLVGPPLKAKDIHVPNTVVDKLGLLMEFQEQQKDKDEGLETSDVKAMLVDLKAKIDNLSQQIEAMNGASRPDPNGNY